MGWQNSTAYGLSTDPGDDWRDLAACRETDPELWWPVGEGPACAKQIERAKAICRRCDVADLCLMYALEQGEREGIWGGMTPTERRQANRPVRSVAA